MVQHQNTDGKITVIPPSINASVAPGKIVGVTGDPVATIVWMPKLLIARRM